MKKLFAVLFIYFAVLGIAAGQQAQLLIKRGDKGLHLDHSVAAKQGLFAIGRLYNVHPKTIAAYNNLDMTKGLSIGQVLQIPLSDTNFSQKSNKGAPVYYQAGDKETLQKVSSVNNKVTVQSLRDWNKLPNDNITAGKKLIVGFLLSGQNPVATTTAPEKKQVPAKEVVEKLPVVKTDIGQEKTVVKNEPKKEEPKRTEPVFTTPQVTADMLGQGFFKSFFDQQVKGTPVSKTETVTSGIFKIVSGPQEAKYYLLVDGIPSGTIIRVINPDNNKTIYAKVLGEIGGTRSNQGLNIRISNGAASSLGITDTEKFIVKINY